MKRLLIFILSFVLALQLFSQEKNDTIVIGSCEKADSIVISPILKITDSTVEKILDSIIQVEKASKYYKKSNCYNIIIDRKNNFGAFCKMYIDVDDFSYAKVIWDIEFSNYYGSMYYNNRQFLIYGEYANLFFEKTNNTQNLVIKYMPYDKSKYDEPTYDESGNLIYYLDTIIIDPVMLWCFYYNNDIWFDYDFYNHKWRYYNYKEGKWVYSE